MSQPHRLSPWLAARVSVQVRQSPLGGSVAVKQNGQQIALCIDTPCSTPAVVANSTLTFTAIPDATHVFVGWESTDGACTGSGASCTMSAQDGRTVTAKFLQRFETSGKGCPGSNASGVSSG